MPGLDRDDVYTEFDEVDCQIDNGSILQLQMESVEENVLDDRSAGSSCTNHLNTNHTKRNSLFVSKPKEEVISVQFIFDWIPSYLLVISKVHKRANQTPKNSPRNTQVAQDDAHPATGLDEAEKCGEVNVRILTISTRQEQQSHFDNENQ